ncbi:MAG: hypothetical protein IT377_27835 [Polyangiaceae bacterium]|nr:hypothetical protein [Polyangiaceae bacterium]
MSKKKIPHLTLLAKPAPSPSNVTPLRQPELEPDARVLVELLEDAAVIHFVIYGEDFPIATLTGGSPRSRFAAAQATGERLLRSLLDEDHPDPERARLARLENDAFDALSDAQGGQHG